MLDRNSSFKFDWDFSDSMTPTKLFVGDKVSMYLHPTDFNVYNNFWWDPDNEKTIQIIQRSLRLALESCKVCKGKDCIGDSVEIIKNACGDGTPLSDLISTPISTLPDVNTYIDTINSEYNYQLAQMTLFQFSNTPESKFRKIFVQCSKKTKFSYSFMWYQLIAKTVCWPI